MPSPSSQAQIAVSQLEKFINDWLLDGELRQLTPRTMSWRRDHMERFLWFLRDRECTAVGTAEIKQYMLYLAKSHEEPEGRWGNPKNRAPMRAVSIQNYHRLLRAFFNWLVEEELLPSSPMKKVPAPVCRTEIKQPLPDELIPALVRAAQRSDNPRRNEAIVLVLLDTGMRATELCSLKMKDLDLAARSFRVLGKGNKYRSGYLGRDATRSLATYLRTQEREPDDTVFVSSGGQLLGQPLKASGLYQTLKRLAMSVGMDHHLCGPHALRRTFAINMLRNGANVFTVQNLLGHTDIEMTRRYCAIAEADVEKQHRTFSPIDRLKIK